MAGTTTQNRDERKQDASGNRGTEQCCDPQLHVLNDLQCYTKQYIQQQPETAALICLGVGFLLGWKLKPW